MNILKRFINFESLTAPLFFGIFIANILVDPIIAPDSGGYIIGDPARPPLYVLFLQLFFLVFGKNFSIIVGAQTLLNLWAIYFFAHKLSVIFKLSWGIRFFIQFTLSIICVPKVFGYTTTYILSEALAYPLFLIFFASLSQGIFLKSQKPLLYSFFFAALTFLTRSQFVFLFVLMGLVVFYIFLCQRKAFKTVILCAALLGTIVGSIFLQKGYIHYKLGGIDANSYTGIQLIAAPLFLGSKEDASLFDAPVEKEIFLKSLEKMEKQSFTKEQLTKNAWPAALSDGKAFMDLYNPIVHLSLNHILGALSIDLKTREHHLMQMTKQWIWHHPIPYAKLYIDNIFQNNLMSHTFTLILSFLALLSLFYHIRHKDALSLFALLVGTTTLGNLSLIAFFEPAMRRYTFYTDVILAILFLILMNKAFQANKSERL